MSRPESFDTIQDSLGESVGHDDDPSLNDGGHLFKGERCVYCRTNIYDIGTYPDAPRICPTPRRPMRYTTETPNTEQRSRIP